MPWVALPRRTRVRRTLVRWSLLSRRGCSTWRSSASWTALTHTLSLGHSCLPAIW